MEEATSLPGSPRTSAPPIRFLTPPASPRRQRTCPSTPPAQHRTQASRWSNLRKKLGTFDAEPVRAPLSPSESDPLPFLDPTKKAWILAAAANDGGKLRGLLQKEPFLLTVSDPYSGYTAMHWAAKHDNVTTLTLLMEHALMLAIGQQVLNWRSSGGYTPLHIAAINQASQAFSLLMMDYKADRKIRDFSGKTATSYLRTVLTTNLALSKIKEKYKGALIDLDAANSK